jgi:hypothetical protein
VPKTILLCQGTANNTLPVIGFRYHDGGVTGQKFLIYYQVDSLAVCDYVLMMEIIHMHHRIRENSVALMTALLFTS